MKKIISFRMLKSVCAGRCTPHCLMGRGWREGKEPLCTEKTCRVFKKLKEPLVRYILVDKSRDI